LRFTCIRTFVVANHHVRVRAFLIRILKAVDAEVLVLGWEVLRDRKPLVPIVGRAALGKLVRDPVGAGLKL
jgi:hypothetical protein